MKKRAIEISTNSKVAVDVNDVLFGRGNFVNSHPGNVNFREIIYTRKIEYDSKTISQKNNVVSYIVREIESSGGRFLKYNRDSNDYHVADAEEVKRKISQALRDCPIENNSKQASTITISNAAGSYAKQGFSPTNDDVLLGRGRRTYNHTGNITFRAVVEKWRSIDLESTDPSNKRQKRDLITSIINEIEGQGGRFLDRDSTSGRWYVADEKKVRRKVVGAWRNIDLRELEVLSPSIGTKLSSISDTDSIIIKDMFT